MNDGHYNHLIILDISLYLLRSFALSTIGIFNDLGLRTW